VAVAGAAGEGWNGMSKILDAMRDGPEDRTDRGDRTEYQLGTIDQSGLFPPPPEKLLLELDHITGSLISRRTSGRGMSLVFTSAASGEGVSFVSYCVARHLAYLLDGRVAWVDGNYLSPHPQLLGHDPSFRSLLEDPQRVADVPAGAGLTTIGHGDRDIKLTELLTCGNYERMLEQFNERFFFTIIDCPAILDAMETAHMARYAHGAVFVVETQRLKYEVVRHGLENLRSQGGRIVGTVLNKRSYQIPGFLYRKL
jgi:Mrp family chromosome partitioning ATPase